MRRSRRYMGCRKLPAEPIDMIYDATIAKLRAAGQSHDPEAMISLLGEHVIIRSPITQRIRFEGIEQASDLFRRVFVAIRNIEFYEVVGGGCPTQVIFWRGTVGETYLEEANLLKMDDSGRIIEMTVFMRAVPGLLELLAELAPSLASRHSKPKAALLRVPLKILSAAYRAAEPLVLSIAKAGVAVPSVPVGPVLNESTTGRN
jgi:hypothetical protein